ncbi:MAG: CdaR family protein [Chloroflexi bacterium]|nr:CdaR family protein [Chloroflexota bacterium]MCL5110232.1 CdaR family protein [Chloroflexota bacterium]
MFGFLQRNLLSLFLSLGLSFVLWAVVVNQQNPEVTKFFESSIPLTVRNIPSGMVVSSVGAETVRVQITTTLDHWNSVAPTSFKAYVDLSKADVGALEYPIKVETTDGQVRVESTQPATTEVRLAVQKRKTVPVRVNILDSVPFGYEAGAPQITPSQVEVVGPQNQVEAVVTAVIDLQIGGARTGINQSFKPEPRDAAGKPITGVELNPPLVVVDVPVVQQVAYKLVPVVPDVSGNVALGYQIVGIVPDPTTVTVVGDPQVLDRLSQVSTQPVDVTRLSSDLHKSTNVVLPSGVSLARSQDIVVRVYINAIQSRQVIQVTPTVKGVSADSVATVNPSTIEVTISGPMPSLLQLGSQDVRAVIDVSGRQPGTYTVAPIVNIPAGLKLESTKPDKVSVTVR